MPFYHRLGLVPQKRHVQFKQPDGSLYKEQVIGTKGFSGISSILYHINPPTQVKEVKGMDKIDLKEWSEKKLRHFHFKTLEAEPEGDYISGRKVLMFNSDVSLAISNPAEGMNYFYKNGEGDELVFVHEGKGVLETNYGILEYRDGDYIIIPRGIIHRFNLKSNKSKFLVIESASLIEIPHRYFNEYGQLLEHAPFCERDFRVPQQLLTINEKGDFEVKIKKSNYLHSYIYGFHPFDVVGWDGFFYPWIFNIEDFEPITGRIHQPPPVHQNFEGHNFVVCSFVPRLFDYHPLSIPVPYNHSNIDSDEVLYYVRGNFMSRKGIDIASFTLHPGGIPHGPHPGTVEASLGKSGTEELAVMLDTFHPLKLTTHAKDFDVPEYPYSWNEEGHTEEIE
ncbi:MAG: homogentisate 1,2-dioxygenase [Ignavibacteriae bacterium]|nr:MAG: homogentisate 1,2-dioxygenase [Ignavibacteriota bacterium]